MNISAFNWVDYTILAMIGLSVFISLIRGFVREALSLATWVVAFWVALSFGSDLGPGLSPYIAHEHLRVIMAFAILFVITLVLGTLVSVLITQVIRKTGLSGMDRLLGVFFGAARGGLLVALLILSASLFAANKEEWWKTSLLIPKVMPMATWLKGYLPENVKLALENGGKDKPKWAALIPDESVFKNPIAQATGNTEANDNPLVAHQTIPNTAANVSVTPETVVNATNNVAAASALSSKDPLPKPQAQNQEGLTSIKQQR